MTEGEKVFFTHYVEYIDHRLHRFFIKILVAFAVLGMCVGASVLYISHVAKENKQGLCAIKGENQRRVVQGEEFLADHPDGIPGLSVDSLRRSTNNAKQTAAALKDISCTDDELNAPIPKETVTP